MSENKTVVDPILLSSPRSDGCGDSGKGLRLRHMHALKSRVTDRQHGSSQTATAGTGPHEGDRRHSCAPPPGRPGDQAGLVRRHTAPTSRAEGRPTTGAPVSPRRGGSATSLTAVPLRRPSRPITSLVRAGEKVAHPDPSGRAASSPSVHGDNAKTSTSTTTTTTAAKSSWASGERGSVAHPFTHAELPVLPLVTQRGQLLSPDRWRSNVIDKSHVTGQISPTLSVAGGSGTYSGSAGMTRTTTPRSPTTGTTTDLGSCTVRGPYSPPMNASLLTSFESLQVNGSACSISHATGSAQRKNSSSTASGITPRGYALPSALLAGRRGSLCTVADSPPPSSSEPRITASPLSRPRDLSCPSEVLTPSGCTSVSGAGAAAGSDSVIRARGVMPSPKTIRDAADAINRYSLSLQSPQSTSLTTSSASKHVELLGSGSYYSAMASLSAGNTLSSSPTYGLLNGTAGSSGGAPYGASVPSPLSSPLLAHTSQMRLLSEEMGPSASSDATLATTINTAATGRSGSAGTVGRSGHASPFMHLRLASGHEDECDANNSTVDRPPLRGHMVSGSASTCPLSGSMSRKNDENDNVIKDLDAPVKDPDTTTITAAGVDAQHVPVDVPREVTRIFITSPSTPDRAPAQHDVPLLLQLPHHSAPAHDVTATAENVERNLQDTLAVLNSPDGGPFTPSARDSTADTPSRHVLSITSGSEELADMLGLGIGADGSMMLMSSSLGEAPPHGLMSTVTPTALLPLTSASSITALSGVFSVSHRIGHRESSSASGSSDPRIASIDLNGAGGSAPRLAPQVGLSSRTHSDSRGSTASNAGSPVNSAASPLCIDVGVASSVGTSAVNRADGLPGAPVINRTTTTNATATAAVATGPEATPMSTTTTTTSSTGDGSSTDGSPARPPTRRPLRLQSTAQLPAAPRGPSSTSSSPPNTATTTTTTTTTTATSSNRATGPLSFESQVNSVSLLNALLSPNGGSCGGWVDSRTGSASEAAPAVAASGAPVSGTLSAGFLSPLELSHSTDGHATDDSDRMHHATAALVPLPTRPIASSAAVAAATATSTMVSAPSSAQQAASGPGRLVELESIMVDSSGNTSSTAPPLTACSTVTTTGGNVSGSFTFIPNSSSSGGSSNAAHGSHHHHPNPPAAPSQRRQSTSLRAKPLVQDTSGGASSRQPRRTSVTVFSPASASRMRRAQNTDSLSSDSLESGSHLVVGGAASSSAFLHSASKSKGKGKGDAGGVGVGVSPGSGELHHGGLRRGSQGGLLTNSTSTTGATTVSAALQLPPSSDSASSSSSLSQRPSLRSQQQQQQQSGMTDLKGPTETASVVSFHGEPSATGATESAKPKITTPMQTYAASLPGDARKAPSGTFTISSGSSVAEPATVETTTAPVAGGSSGSFSGAHSLVYDPMASTVDGSALLASLHSVDFYMRHYEALEVPLASSLTLANRASNSGSTSGRGLQHVLSLSGLRAAGAPRLDPGMVAESMRKLSGTTITSVAETPATSTAGVSPSTGASTARTSAAGTATRRETIDDEVDVHGMRADTAAHAAADVNVNAHAQEQASSMAAVIPTLSSSSSTDAANVPATGVAPEAEDGASPLTLPMNGVMNLAPVSPKNTGAASTTPFISSLFTVMPPAMHIPSTTDIHAMLVDGPEDGLADLRNAVFALGNPLWRGAVRGEEGSNASIGNLLASQMMRLRLASGSAACSTKTVTQSEDEHDASEVKVDVQGGNSTANDSNDGRLVGTRTTDPPRSSEDGASSRVTHDENSPMDATALLEASPDGTAAAQAATALVMDPSELSPGDRWGWFIDTRPMLKVAALQQLEQDCRDAAEEGRNVLPQQQQQQQQQQSLSQQQLQLHASTSAIITSLTALGLETMLASSQDVTPLLAQVDLQQPYGPNLNDAVQCIGAGGHTAWYAPSVMDASLTPSLFSSVFTAMDANNSNTSGYARTLNTGAAVRTGHDASPGDMSATYGSGLSRRRSSRRWRGSSADDSLVWDHSRTDATSPPAVPALARWQLENRDTVNTRRANAVHTGQGSNSNNSSGNGEGSGVGTGGGGASAAPAAAPTGGGGGGLVLGRRPPGRGFNHHPVPPGSSAMRRASDRFRSTTPSSQDTLEPTTRGRNGRRENGPTSSPIGVRMLDLANVVDAARETRLRAGFEGVASVSGGSGGGGDGSGSLVDDATHAHANAVPRLKLPGHVAMACDDERSLPSRHTSYRPLAGAWEGMGTFMSSVATGSIMAESSYSTLTSAVPTPRGGAGAGRDSRSSSEYAHPPDSTDNDTDEDGAKARQLDDEDDEDDEGSSEVSRVSEDSLRQCRVTVGLSGSSSGRAPLLGEVGHGDTQAFNYTPSDGAPELEAGVSAQQQQQQQLDKSDGPLRDDDDDANLRDKKPTEGTLQTRKAGAGTTTTTTFASTARVPMTQSALAANVASHATGSTRNDGAFLVAVSGATRTTVSGAHYATTAATDDDDCCHLGGGYGATYPFVSRAEHLISSSKALTALFRGAFGDAYTLHLDKDYVDEEGSSNDLGHRRDSRDAFDGRSGRVPGGEEEIRAMLAATHVDDATIAGAKDGEVLDYVLPPSHRSRRLRDVMGSSEDDDDADEQDTTGDLSDGQDTRAVEQAMAALLAAPHSPARLLPETTSAPLHALLLQSVITSESDIPPGASATAPPGTAADVTFTAFSSADVSGDHDGVDVSVLSGGPVRARGRSPREGDGHTSGTDDVSGVITPASRSTARPCDLLSPATSATAISTPSRCVSPATGAPVGPRPPTEPPSHGTQLPSRRGSRATSTPLSTPHSPLHPRGDEAPPPVLPAAAGSAGTVTHEPLNAVDAARAQAVHTPHLDYRPLGMPTPPSLPRPHPNRAAQPASVFPIHPHDPSEAVAPVAASTTAVPEVAISCSASGATTVTTTTTNTTASISAVASSVSAPRHRMLARSKPFRAERVTEAQMDSDAHPPGSSPDSELSPSSPHDDATTTTTAVSVKNTKVPARLTRFDTPSTTTGDVQASASAHDSDAAQRAPGHGRVLLDGSIFGMKLDDVLSESEFDSSCSSSSSSS